MPEHSVTIGNVRITSLSDGHLQFTTKELFPSVPEEAWAPYRDQLTADGRIAMNIGAFVLRSDGKTIIVDTGLGTSAEGFQDALTGLLLKDMKAKGVRPAEIDMVLITHLHRDHVGWNLVRDDEGERATFPNARYWVPKGDWDVYTRRAGMAMFSYINEQVVPLERLGVLELMEGERTLTDELTTLPTPGHTPGHTSVLVSSLGERGVILGDVSHVPAQFQETDWSPRADTNPKRSRATRRQLMDRIERDASLVISGHYPAPGFGRLARMRGRRYWQAL